MRHRDVLGASFAQQAAKRVHVLGGQCSVIIPDEVGPPNGVLTPNRLSPRRAAPRRSRKAGADLAERACARLRGDPVEHHARALALGRPHWGARRHQVGLRTQDDAVLDHLEAVGGERRPGGGDVDDEFGGAGGRRASVAPELSTMR